jgi:hypothetical protein
VKCISITMDIRLLTPDIAQHVLYASCTAYLLASAVYVLLKRFGQNIQFTYRLLQLVNHAVE